MLFRTDPPPFQVDKVVEGKACSVINTAVFAAQMTAALTVGPVATLAGSNIYIIFLCCVSSALAFFVAIFISMPFL